jgi:hypothetical protein
MERDGKMKMRMKELLPGWFTYIYIHIHACTCAFLSANHSDNAMYAFVACQ